MEYNVKLFINCSYIVHCIIYNMKMVFGEVEFQKGCFL